MVGIINTAGTRLVTYTYDPWGNPLTLTDSTSAGIGTLNPFRYRGYIYDAETGLYYCNSRYYDPEVGRFINADSQLNIDEGVLGCNMYTYCLNNPVTGTTAAILAIASLPFHGTALVIDVFVEE